MRSVALAWACLLGALPVGAARAAPRVWVVPAVTLDDQVAPEAAPRVDEQLLSALAARHDLELPELAQRAGAHESSGVADARAALASGREQYQKFHFKEAEAAFARAVTLIESAGVPPGEANTLTTAMTELAVVQAAMNQTAAARDTCDALLTVRPDVRFDPIRVPPNLIKLCEAERSKRSLQTRRVSLTGAPPFQQVYVDGQPMGSSPVSLELPLGTHYLLYVGQNRLTLVEKLLVGEGGEPLQHAVQMPERPEEKLTAALRGKLRRRGPLPQTVEATRALGLVVNADAVVSVGIERASSDTLRLYVGRVERSGAPHVVVAEVHDDLHDLRPVLDQVAALIGSPALAPGPTFVPPVAEAAQKLDYESALFGVNPEAKPLLGAEEESPRKKKKKWVWLWVTGAVVVVGGAVTAGLLLGLNNGKLQINALTPPTPMQ